MNLQTQTKTISGVVSLKDDTRVPQALASLLVACLAERGNVAAIVHDKDIDGYGRLKTLHLHFVFSGFKRVRLITVLNDVAKALAVPVLAVSVEKCASVSGALQYLTHKNNPQKAQYYENDIVRQWDEDEYNLLLNAENDDKLTADGLCQVCINANTLIDVMRALGVSMYQHYRATILDVWQSTESARACRRRSAQQALIALEVERLHADDK